MNCGNVSRFFYAQNFALVAATYFAPAELSQYYYGSSPDSASMQKYALTAFASGAIWAAVAQTEFEACRRKMVQYGMLTFVFQMAVLFYYQGAAVVADDAFSAQVGLAAFNFALCCIACYYTDKEAADYGMGEKDASLTWVLRFEYLFLLTIGATFSLCPWVYAEYLGGSSTTASEFWMASIGAISGGMSCIIMAAAQCDEEVQKTLLQYGMVKHFLDLFWGAGLVGPALIAADSTNGLMYAYGYSGFAFLSIMYVISAVYPSTNRKMLIRTIYMSMYTMCVYLYFWPSFMLVLLQYTDASKVAAFPEFMLYLSMSALVFTAVSQFEDEEQKKCLQYFLGALILALAVASTGVDMGVMPYKYFAVACLVTIDLYAEYAAKKFGKIKLPKFKLPKIALPKLPSFGKKAQPMSKMSTSMGKSRSKTPMRK